MEIDQDITTLSELIAMERQVWDALRDGNAAADEALLSDEFVGIYPDGFSDKKGHVAQLSAGPTVLSFELDQERTLAAGQDYVLLMYRAQFRRLDGRAARMFISSLWHRRETGWINLFSQDTPAS